MVRHNGRTSIMRTARLVFTHRFGGQLAVGVTSSFEPEEFLGASSAFRISRTVFSRAKVNRVFVRGLEVLELFKTTNLGD
jgi:hypothetical protein